MANGFCSLEPIDISREKKWRRIRVFAEKKFEQIAPGRVGAFE
jgi:hypothetical protein